MKKDKMSLIILYGILIVLVAVQALLFLSMPKDVQKLQTSQYMYSEGKISVYMGDSYGNDAKIYLQINGTARKQLYQGGNEIKLKEGDYIAVLTEGMEAGVQYSNIVLKSDVFSIPINSYEIRGGLTPIGRMNLKKN